MRQLLKNEFKLQPWTLFFLFFTILCLLLSVPAYRSQKSNLANATLEAKQSNLPMPKSTADLPDFYLKWAIKDARTALEIGEKSSFPHRIWRTQIKQIIESYQNADYLTINKRVNEMLTSHQDYTTNENEIFSLYVQSSTSRNLTHYFIDHQINAFPRIHGNIGLFDPLIRQIGGGIGGGRAISAESDTKGMLVPIFILSFSILIFSLNVTRNHRQHTDEFTQTLPVSPHLVTFIQIFLPWLLINLLFILSLIVSALILHSVTGLPYGNLSYAQVTLIQREEIVVPLYAYFGLMLFYLNLWIIFLAIVSLLISQLSKSPITIIFCLTVTLFLRELGLLTLIPKSARYFLPSNYARLHLMFLQQSEYDGINPTDVLLIFFSWLFVCLILINITNRIRRKHYLTILNP